MNLIILWTGTTEELGEFYRYVNKIYKFTDEYSRNSLKSIAQKIF